MRDLLAVVLFSLACDLGRMQRASVHCPSPAPSGRRRVVLSSLPPYALFRTNAGFRGLTLAWHRTRDGVRREASVLLLHGRADDKPAIRNALRADLVVKIDERDNVVDLSTRDVTERDVFAGRYVRGAAVDEETTAHEAGGEAVRGLEVEEAA